MNALNLLPRANQIAGRRRRRIHVWTTVNGVLAAALLVATLQAWPSGRILDDDRGRAADVEREHDDIRRRVTVALRNQAVLVERARALEALNREHLLARQLAELAESAPESIRLTRLTVRMADGPATRPAKEPPRSESERAAPAVEVVGCAVSHDDVRALLRAIQKIPAWEDVSLRRAAVEKVGEIDAVGFTLECRPRRGER